MAKKIKPEPLMARYECPNCKNNWLSVAPVTQPVGWRCPYCFIHVAVAKIAVTFETWGDKTPKGD